MLSFLEIGHIHAWSSRVLQEEVDGSVTVAIREWISIGEFSKTCIDGLPVYQGLPYICVQSIVYKTFILRARGIQFMIMRLFYL